MLKMKQQTIYIYIGKHGALSREVICYFRLYLEIGWTSVKPN